MTLPRFLNRIVDATAPVLGGLDRDAVRDKLESSSVTLVGGERASGGASRAGFLLAANLLARLYPHIRLQGPDELVHAAEGEIVLVNPAAEVTTGVTGSDASASATLGYEAVVLGDVVVAVAARGWNVYVDVEADADGEPAAPAALLAATLGVGELFRAVFGDELGSRGRRGRQPGAFNLVTLVDPSFDLPVPDAVDLGGFRLVGAGAIGQAAAHTLALASARGTMIAVDQEKVSLSNLQRYVLTRDSDVGAVKVDLLRERLARSALDVVPVEAEWHAGLVDEQLPTLVALDSPEDRIGVQASLPFYLQRLDAAGRRRLVAPRALRRRTLPSVPLLAGARGAEPARSDRHRLLAASPACPRLPRPSPADRPTPPARRRTRRGRARLAARR